MEELIVNKARELFFRYGLKRISMDDLSRDAGISKKTVYQFISDKNELVIKVAQRLVQCHEEGLEQCRKLASDAVAEVVLQANMPFAGLAAISQSFFYDLEKFHPEAWRLLMQHRQQDVLPCISNNLLRGIKERVYRQDIDLELTPHIRLQQLQSVLQPGAFTALQSGAQPLMRRLTRFFLHSITTAKGSALIDQYLNESTILIRNDEHKKAIEKHNS